HGLELPLPLPESPVEFVAACQPEDEHRSRSARDHDDPEVRRRRKLTGEQNDGRRSRNDERGRCARSAVVAQREEDPGTAARAHPKLPQTPRHAEFFMCYPVERYS